MTTTTTETCPVCGGPGTPLGQLGRRTYLRCRACGMDFSPPVRAGERAERISALRAEIAWAHEHGRVPERQLCELAAYGLDEPHDCDEHAVPYTSDGALGHGFECGVCGKFLQAG